MSVGFFFFRFYLFFVFLFDGCFVYMYVTSMPMNYIHAVPAQARESIGSLGLELEAIVSPYVGYRSRA